MKRIQLFEFEDLAWFPNGLRICLTRYIVAFHKILGTRKPLAALLARALPKASHPRIVDLCSGAGGPMLDVAEELRDEHGFPELELTLSDLYPNQKAAAEIAADSNPLNTYRITPVNATEVDPALKGVRTMVCSMHHMPPEVARDILSDAQEQKQPICIYEISDNSPPKFLWWIAIPIGFLMVFFITPFVRPMSWQQLVFTYLIPILPFFIAWDGAVSNVRTYTLGDMEELLAPIRKPGYTWEMGAIKGKGGKKLYLLGLPE